MSIPEGVLKIVTHGSATPKNWEVFLDGVSIANRVRRIKIDIGASGLPEIWIEFVARLEVPDELKGYVVATKNAADKAESEAELLTSRFMRSLDVLKDMIAQLPTAQDIENSTRASQQMEI